jgi:GntR family transcriptional regulator, rspAB operon transcriptional repressor
MSIEAVKISGEPSYARQTYDFIIQQILEGKLKPGDEVNRKGVASELGVSLAPVSEAVNQLESEGFLEISPRRQTRVRIVTKEEVRGLLILREAIECQAVRLYCGERINKQRTALMKLARAVDSSEAGSKENELAESKFHQALVDLVDCEMLSVEFQKVMRRKLFMKINIIVPWNVQPPLDSHERLVEELCANDPDAAEAAMRKHLERGRERILQ